MAFSWVEDIGKKTADITKAAMEEIRTNLDQIKDNEACITDKVTYKGAQQTAVDGDYNSVYYVDQHSAYDNDVNTGVDSGDNSSYYNNQHGTYKSGYDIGVDGAYNSGVNTNYESVFYSSHFPYN